MATPRVDKMGHFLTDDQACMLLIILSLDLLPSYRTFLPPKKAPTPPVHPDFDRMKKLGREIVPLWSTLLDDGCLAGEGRRIAERFVSTARL